MRRYAREKKTTERKAAFVIALLRYMRETSVGRKTQIKERIAQNLSSWPAWMERWTFCSFQRKRVFGESVKCYIRKSIWIMGFKNLDSTLLDWFIQYIWIGSLVVYEGMRRFTNGFRAFAFIIFLFCKIKLRLLCLNVENCHYDWFECWFPLSDIFSGVRFSDSSINA